MSSSPTSLCLHTRIEDVLEHLPISCTTEYRKGRMIYGPNNPSTQYLSRGDGQSGDLADSRRRQGGAAGTLSGPTSYLASRLSSTFPALPNGPPPLEKCNVDDVGHFRHGRSRHETAPPCRGIAADPCAAQRRTHAPDRELFNRHDRTSACAFPPAIFRALGHPGRRWRCPNDAFHSPASVPVRRYLARAHLPLYEPVPEKRLCELFAAGNTSLSGHSQDGAQ